MRKIKVLKEVIVTLFLSLFLFFSVLNFFIFHGLRTTMQIVLLVPVLVLAPE